MQILVAGATGDLGARIVKELLDQNADVRALVRPSSSPEKVEQLKALGAEICVVEEWKVAELRKACEGISCVVSALAGLREVVIDAQKILLDATIAAGVPRFIPSDYSLDFTKFSYGENRNLDLRREFHEYLDSTSIGATSVFNGAFAELVTDEMPFLLFKQKIVLYWGNPDYRWGFTTKDNTAEYTARVALDPSAPRYLRIAGDQISPREARAAVSELTGEKFRFFRPGGQGLLGFIIKIARKFQPAENDLYPAWQGMQYMHNMVDERANLDHLDNDRYPGIQWTTIKEVVREHLKQLS